MKRSLLSQFPILLLAILTSSACHDGAGYPTPLPGGIPVVLKALSGNEQVGETGRPLDKPITVLAITGSGEEAEGLTVRFEVIAGGGSLSAYNPTTDCDGTVSVQWTLGPPPVWNRVRAEARGSTVTFQAWAEPGDPPILDLVHEAPAGMSAEDLAFRPGRGLYLGSPGSILHAQSPGVPFTELPLTGAGIYHPVGIAFGPEGDLYACENILPECASVKRIRPNGEVSILSEGYQGEPFALPNYIAVDDQGQLYLSASCGGMIYRIDPDTGETKEFLAITGPNGLAFTADYRYLYIATENPSLFCPAAPSVQGGLYRVKIGPNGSPGPVETLIDRFAIAGDGLAFDAEGNLYIVFTGIQGCDGFEGLLTSGVFVYTPDGKFNELFSVDLPGDIITNVAFGKAPFDPHLLYCYGFTGRLYRADVGIPGQPLHP